MATTRTAVILKTGAEGHPELPLFFEDATGHIVDGCLVIQSHKLTVLYAPGEWLRAWTEKADEQV